MKRLLYLFCAGLFVAGGLVHAQGVVPKDKQGDKAIIFSINGFGDFGINGISIGMVAQESDEGTESIPVVGAGARLYLADRMALRVGAGFGMTSNSPSDSLTPDSSSTVIAISPGIEIHMMNAGPISPYIGGMIEFATSSSKVTRNIGSVSSETTHSSSSFGVAAMLGAEFFPWSNVSFGAEYMIGFRSTSGSFKSTSGSSTTESDAPGRTEIGIGSAAVFLSIYI